MGEAAILGRANRGQGQEKSYRPGRGERGRTIRAELDRARQVAATACGLATCVQRLMNPLMAVTHADGIRGIIQKQYKVTDAKTKAIEGLSTSIQVSPLGLDRDKKRIWSFDCESAVLRGH